MRNTQKVRNILREQDAARFGGLMYTNKYPTCRTVKSYLGNDEAKKVMKRVENRLKEEMIPGSVKFIPSTMGYARRSEIGSLIVRLPL